MHSFRHTSSARPRTRVALVGVLLAGTAAALAQDADGPLDRPVIPADPGAVKAPALVVEPAPGSVGRPAVDATVLQEEVRAEQETLEALPREELERRAEDGERGAQVALGNDFAKEAELLGFAPAAANDALADAARWYSTAAARGFPGAPSLDQAGVRFWPIRIQRETRP